MSLANKEKQLVTFATFLVATLTCLCMWLFPEYLAYLIAGIIVPFFTFILHFLSSCVFLYVSRTSGVMPYTKLKYVTQVCNIPAVSLLLAFSLLIN